MPTVDDGSRVAIRADSLTMRFDDETVINDLDLDIAPGTIVGLIGPSGCGKTTTVRMLIGALRPTDGTAFVGGTPSTELTPHQRARIGYLPQTPALFPELSVWENLSFHASMYGLPLRRRRHLRSLLDWVELRGDRRKRVRDISGGMQRRLALAATLVHDPTYVFLDEPTAGIDPILREKLWTEFRALRDSGRTLLVTTQYVGEASYCDLVGLLSDGELLMLDTPENMRRAAFDGEVVDVALHEVPTDAQVAQIRAQPFVLGEVERIGPTGLRIVVDDASTALEEVSTCVTAAGLSIIDASEHMVDYDEAFVRVVERHRSVADATAAVAAGSDGDRDGDGEGSALPPPHASADVTSEVSRAGS